MSAASTSQENTFAIQAIMGGAVRYNRWIYSRLQPWLGQRILDVGSGYGHITAHFFERERERIVSLDLEPQYVEALRRRFAGHAVFEAHCMDAARLGDAGSGGKLSGFDTVTCVNVLEHIEDDVELLEAFRTALAPGGRVVLFVPALPWLYGSMDAADHHFRRYTRATVSATLSRAGLEPEHVRYFNFVGTFGWFVNGRLLGRKLIPEGQLGWFDRLVPALAWVERRLPIPFGQSLIAVGRKPAGSP